MRKMLKKTYERDGDDLVITIEETNGRKITRRVAKQGKLLAQLEKAGNLRVLVDNTPEPTPEPEPEPKPPKPEPTSGPE